VRCKRFFVDLVVKKLHIPDPFESLKQMK